MSWNRLFLAVTVSKTPDRWIVMAIMGVITRLLVSNVVMAADEAPAPSPTVQEVKATPADPGQVQERTVSLTQAVHFTDATGQDVVVGPGSYQVDAAGTNRIRLVPAETGESVAIEAVSFTHQQTIERPVAITVPDPQQPDVLHLALLLPGGQGVGAFGTYSVVKPRGVTDTALVMQVAAPTAATLQTVLPPSPSLLSVTPNHGPSGTPVFVQGCGYQGADLNKTGALSIGGKPVRQLAVRQWCNNLQSIFEIQGPPGPVQVRLDVPGGLRPAEIATFTVDPGPALVLSPRWKIVFGGAGVLDRETGLVWERAVPLNGSLLYQTEAGYGCQQARTGARLGWRLPTAAEAGMLMDATSNPAGLPTGHPFFIVKPHGEFWLSDKFTELSASATQDVEITVAYITNLLGSITGIRIVTVINDHTTGTQKRLSAGRGQLNIWCVRGPGGVPIQ